MTEPWLHIILVEPEIPPNTGNVGRLCLGLGLRLHVVRPAGFSMDDKAVRRAGLDYWRHVDVAVHEDLEACWSWLADRPVHVFSGRGALGPYTQCPFARGDALMFGKESVGLPDELVAERGAWHIPMTGPIRSLNLSNAVAVVSYGAMGRIRPELF